MADAMSTASSGARGPQMAWALAIHTGTTIVFLGASSALTPLYRLYQQALGFAPGLLTLIFAIYAFGLLVALIFAGSLSDHLGRRPVIAVAIGIELVAMGLFIVAAGPGWLLAARFIQGLATGLATAGLAAALIDHHDQHGPLINTIAPMFGLALGAIGTSALVEWAPDPLHLVFFVVSGLLVLLLGLTLRTPETIARRPGALRALRPRITVPARARGDLIAVTPINVSAWALGGFYLSLMPSLIAMVTGSPSTWLGGASVAALSLSGAVAILFVRKRAPYKVLVLGASALVGGLGVTLFAANTANETLLFLGSILAGLGFGAGFLGAVRSVAPLADPGERAGLMAAFYVESYLANSVPAILAGYLAQRLDLLTVANLYGGVLVVLSLAGLFLTTARHRAQRRRHQIRSVVRSR